MNKLYMNKKNKKAITHGYWERKYHNGEVVCKYTFNNGILLGYKTRYDANSNGEIYSKQISI